MLNGERVPSSNRQPSTADVTAESRKEISIPVKFRSDIDTLKTLFPEDFDKKTEIVMTLKDALSFLPRDRKRVDAYAALCEWLKNNMGIVLTIKSQKTK